MAIADGEQSNATRTSLPRNHSFLSRIFNVIGGRCGRRCLGTVSLLLIEQGDLDCTLRIRGSLLLRNHFRGGADWFSISHGLDMLDGLIKKQKFWDTQRFNILQAIQLFTLQLLAKLHQKPPKDVHTY